MHKSSSKMVIRGGGSFMPPPGVHRTQYPPWNTAKENIHN